MSEEQTEYNAVEPEVIEAPEVPAFEPDQLMKKVENLAKENKNLIRSQQAMAQHFKTMVDSTVKQRVQELNIAKDEAIDLGDKQRVREIEQQIETAQIQSRTADIPPQVDPAIKQFIDENDWFNKDQEMTSFAVAYNESYLKTNQGSIEESLEKTLAKVKQAFPDKFDKEKKDTPPPSPVESAGRALSTNNRYTMSRLDNEQKVAYNQYVKVHKLMSHDDYFKSLDDAGYLK